MLLFFLYELKAAKGHRTKVPNRNSAHNAFRLFWRSGCSIRGDGLTLAGEDRPYGRHDCLVSAAGSDGRCNTI